MNGLITRIVGHVRGKGRHAKHRALQVLSQKMLYYTFDAVDESFVDLIVHPDSLYMYLAGRAYRTVPPADFFRSLQTDMTAEQLRGVVTRNPFLLLTRMPDGSTPLHVPHRRREMTDVLVEHGCDTYATNDQGHEVRAEAWPAAAPPFQRLPHAVSVFSDAEHAICERALTASLEQRRWSAAQILVRFVPGCVRPHHAARATEPLLSWMMKSILGQDEDFVARYRAAREAPNDAHDDVLAHMMSAWVFFPDDIDVVRAGIGRLHAARLRCTIMDEQVKHILCAMVNRDVNADIVGTIFRHRNLDLLHTLRDCLSFNATIPTDSIPEDDVILSALMGRVPRRDPNHFLISFCLACDIDVSPDSLISRLDGYLVDERSSTPLVAACMRRIIRLMKFSSFITCFAACAVRLQSERVLPRNIRINPRRIYVLDVLSSLGYPISGDHVPFAYTPRFHAVHLQHWFVRSPQMQALRSAPVVEHPSVHRVWSDHGPFASLAVRSSATPCTHMADQGDKEISQQGSILYDSLMDSTLVRCASDALDAQTFPCHASKWSRDLYILSFYNATILCAENVWKDTDVPLQPHGRFHGGAHLLASAGVADVDMFISENKYRHIGPPSGCILSLSSSALHYVLDYMRAIIMLDPGSRQLLHRPEHWPLSNADEYVYWFETLMAHIRFSGIPLAHTSDDVVFSSAFGGMLLRDGIRITLATNNRRVWNVLMQYITENRACAENNAFVAAECVRLFFDLHPNLATPANQALFGAVHAPRRAPPQSHTVRPVYMYVWQLLSSADAPSLLPERTPDAPHEHSMHVLLQRYRIHTACSTNTNTHIVRDRLRRLGEEDRARPGPEEEEDPHRRRRADDVDAPVAFLLRFYPRTTRSICDELYLQMGRSAEPDRAYDLVRLSRNATKECIFFESDEERDAFVATLIDPLLQRLREQMRVLAPDLSDFERDRCLQEHRYNVRAARRTLDEQRDVAHKVHALRTRLASWQEPPPQWTNGDIMRHIVLHRDQKDRIEHDWADAFAAFASPTAPPRDDVEEQLLRLQSQARATPARPADRRVEGPCMVCEEATTSYCSCDHPICMGCISMQATVAKEFPYTCLVAQCTGAFVFDRVPPDVRTRVMDLLHLNMRANAVTERECRSCHMRVVTLNVQHPLLTSIECIRCHTISCALCIGSSPHDGTSCAHDAVRRTSTTVPIPAIDDAGDADTAEARRTGRPCPTCGIVVTRDGGCISMACGACRTRWCWECGGPAHGHSQVCSRSVALSVSDVQRRHAVLRDMEKVMQHWSRAAARKAREADVAHNSYRASTLQTCYMLVWSVYVHMMERPRSIPHRGVLMILHKLIRCIYTGGIGDQTLTALAYPMDALHAAASNERFAQPVEEELARWRHITTRLVSMYDTVHYDAETVPTPSSMHPFFAYIRSYSEWIQARGDETMDEFVDMILPGQHEYATLHERVQTRAIAQWSAAKDRHARTTEHIHRSFGHIGILHEYFIALIEHAHRKYATILAYMDRSTTDAIADCPHPPAPMQIDVDVSHIKRFDVDDILRPPVFAARPSFQEQLPLTIYAEEAPLRTTEFDAEWMAEMTTVAAPHRARRRMDAMDVDDE